MKTNLINWVREVSKFYVSLPGGGGGECQKKYTDHIYQNKDSKRLSFKIRKLRIDYVASTGSAQKQKRKIFGEMRKLQKSQITA